jgi:uncharacterized phage protein gp47/JayE
MYEDRTFPVILQEMLDLVPEDVDKREGSVIYNSLAPAAKKLAKAYEDLDKNNRLAHAQTSSNEELRRIGIDRGINPLEPKKAIRKGLFFDAQAAPFDVPINSRYAIGSLTFKAIEKISVGVYKIECETAGTFGNTPMGALLPIEYVDGLASANLADILFYGEDAETDEAYKARYFVEVRTPPTSGNKAAYMGWALEVISGGAAYVEPAWNGPNTVKISLLGADKKPASAAQVQAVKDYIDPNIGLGEGMGEGAAPAGALLTAVAAPGVDINVVATVTLTGSRTLAQAQADFESSLASYFASIAYSSDRNVKFARLGTLLLDTPGVSDYDSASLLVNGAQTNVTVPAGSVAVKGTVTLS